MDELLYQEQILEHYKHPLHKGILPEYSFSSYDLNPLCGDEIVIYGKVHPNGMMSFSFTGQGCAISLASASLLLDSIQMKTKEEILTLTFENVYHLLGIPISPGRVKCALLSLNTLKKGLEEYAKRA
jgi:nitrogen fixation NifU-like protein